VQSHVNRYRCLGRLGPCASACRIRLGDADRNAWGLIGLRGAEFRLPLLISLFRFRGLEAVILNKATSLVVVATALPFRAATVPFSDIGAHWPIIVNLLCGSLAGAWFGAGWATRLKSETLYNVIAVLLVIIAGVLLFAHDRVAGAPPFVGWVQIIAGKTARKADAVLAPNQNIENNPMQSSRGRWHRCFSLRKHFDTSGKSAAPLHRRAICKIAHALPIEIAVAVPSTQKCAAMGRLLCPQGAIHVRQSDS
jgi:hypothetical protein